MPDKEVFLRIVWREEDLNNELTYIALSGASAAKLTSRLPLALRRPTQVTTPSSKDNSVQGCSA